MRVHTIPQNVTSYEDKIVGALIGRQFIYLAIGGVIVFIFLTTNVGPLPVRLLFSILVGGLAAAMALLKINERGFDIWVLSFLKAVLGPTEWVWVQDKMVMTFLIETDIVAKVDVTKPVTEVETNQNNLERLSQFEHFLESNHTTMDTEEQEFVSRLNFGEMVPQSAFQAAKSTQAPPPMLTKQNHNRPAQPPAQKLFKPVIFNPNQPKPVSPLATESARPQLTFLVDGKQQSIQLLSNQRINRSLSRQLLSGGTLPLPVRGELQISLPTELKQELTTLIGFAPALDGSITNSALSVVTAAKASGNSLPSHLAGPSTPPPATVTFSSVTPPPAGPMPDSQSQQAPDGNQAEPTPAQPATPPNPVTKSEPVAPSLPPSVPQPTPAEPPIPTSQPIADGPSIQDSLVQAEAQANAALAALNQSAPAPTVSAPPADTSQAAPNQTEAPSQPAPAAETNQKPSNPVGSLFNGIKQSLSSFEVGNRQSEGQPTQPPQPTVDASVSVRPILNPSHTDASAAVAPTIAQAAVVPLTNEPNMVNGLVLDAAGQFLAGVVVVVKDSQGDPKRALKTNKLGQFVITTPLDNGTYMVEVDKKGLSFDIMKVDLNGSVLPALEIRAKA